MAHLVESCFGHDLLSANLNEHLCQNFKDDEQVLHSSEKPMLPFEALHRIVSPAAVANLPSLDMDTKRHLFPQLVASSSSSSSSDLACAERRPTAPKPRRRTTASVSFFNDAEWFYIDEEDPFGAPVCKRLRLKFEDGCGGDRSPQLLWDSKIPESFDEDCETVSTPKVSQLPHNISFDEETAAPPTAKLLLPVRLDRHVYENQDGDATPRHNPSVNRDFCFGDGSSGEEDDGQDSLTSDAILESSSDSEFHPAKVGARTPKACSNAFQFGACSNDEELAADSEDEDGDGVATPVLTCVARSPGRISASDKEDVTTSKASKALSGDMTSKSALTLDFCFGAPIHEKADGRDSVAGDMTCKTATEIDFHPTGEDAKTPKSPSITLQFGMWSGRMRSNSDASTAVPSITSSFGEEGCCSLSSDDHPTNIAKASLILPVTIERRVCKQVDGDMIPSGDPSSGLDEGEDCRKSATLDTMVEASSNFDIHQADAGARTPKSTSQFGFRAERVGFNSAFA